MQDGSGTSRSRPEDNDRQARATFKVTPWNSAMKQAVFEDETSGLSCWLTTARWTIEDDPVRSTDKVDEDQEAKVACPEDRGVDQPEQTH